MSDHLKSDLLRTALVTLALLVFPLFIRTVPAPAGILTIADWHFAPLNAALADRFYTQATKALRAGNQELEKSWLISAIQVDPQAFSPRYKEFITQRTQWLER